MPHGNTLKPDIDISCTCTKCGSTDMYTFHLVKEEESRIQGEQAWMLSRCSNLPLYEDHR